MPAVGERGGEGRGDGGGGEKRKMGAGVNDSVVPSSRKKPHFNVNLPHQSPAKGKKNSCVSDVAPTKKKQKTNLAR